MMYSSIFFFPVAMWAIYVFLKDNKDIVFLCMIYLLFLFSLGHLIFVVIETHNALNIVSNNIISPYISGVDNLILRLFPLPLCFMLFEGASLAHPEFATMSGQVNVPLLFVAIISNINLYKYARMNKYACFEKFFISTLYIILSIIIIYISVKQVNNVFINYFIIGIGQFPYRLITYINSYFLMSLFISTAIMQRINEFYHRNAIRSLYVCLIGVMFYFLQIWILYEERNSIVDIIFPTALQSVSKVQNTTIVPEFVYGYLDYSTVSAFTMEEHPSDAHHIALFPEQNTNNTLVSEDQDIDDNELLLFSVMPFVWNVIYAINLETENVVRYDMKSLRAHWTPLGLYMGGLPKGLYRFEARFEPPQVWNVLRILFKFAVFTFVAGSVLAGYRITRECYYGGA